MTELLNSVGSRQLATLLDATDRRLHIIGSRNRIDSRPPDVRTQFGEREPRIVRNDPFAQFGTRLPRATRTQVEVVDVHANCCREYLAISWFGGLEEGSEVHTSMIDQFDLLHQIFLHVDQND